MSDVAKGIRECLDTINKLREENASQAAEIARLRAAINDALTAPWPDPVLNSTWHQEPIGPNETPEEAIKRLVGVRAEWAVYKNNCENPEIAELRAELAAARREGMEAMAEKIAGWHEAQATEYEAQARKFENLKTISDFTSANPAPDGFQYAVRYAEGAAMHRQRAAAIRAEAKEGKP